MRLRCSWWADPPAGGPPLFGLGASREEQGEAGYGVSARREQKSVSPVAGSLTLARPSVRRAPAAGRVKDVGQRSAAVVQPGGMVVERLLPAAILVIAAIGAPVMIFSGEGLPRLRALDAELAAVRKENDDERRQIGFLRKNVQKLKDEPATVERIARDELGLVRRNEVVFQFPSNQGPSPSR